VQHAKAARWTRRHVLDTDDWSRAEIEAVLETTGAMVEILKRPVRKAPPLRGKTVILFFAEASTRTRVSFELAAKALSADVVNITASGSSVEKGESLLDSVRTLQALGGDVIVLRHSSSGAPYFVADRVDAAVINAGDGWHAHPTQALLDLFTIRERLGHISGLRVAIIGDILHSRVARSNLWGLTRMGADVVLCGPPTMLPRSSFCSDLPWPVEITYRLDDALRGADVIMVLRMQLERQTGGLFPSLREYVRTYALTEERLARARPGALVMHPGPMNEGVEIDPRVARGAQSVIEAQVTNGVAVRMALLYRLSGLEA
jgi:aspartate carbamoyltransferase catalytic subunit